MIVLTQYVQWTGWNSDAHRHVQQKQQCEGVVNIHVRWQHIERESGVSLVKFA